MSRIIRVFYIHHSKDEKLLKELQKQMAVLKSHGVISEWSKSNLYAGDSIAGTIAGQFSAADIILPLISPDFYSSDDCMAAMAQARAKHDARQACVIPIILRPCLLNNPRLEGLVLLPRKPKSIDEIKPVTRWENRDEAFLSIAEVLCRVIDRVQSGEEFDRLWQHIDVNNSEDIGRTIKRVQTKAAATMERQARWSENLLPYLCDRRPQDERLEREIDDGFVDDEPAAALLELRRPLVWIIHGNDEECVGMYRQRLQEFSLRRFLRADSHRFLIRHHYLRLPQEVSNPAYCLKEFQRDLAEKITLSRYTPAEKVIEDISKADVPVFIYSSLDTALWEPHAPAIIDAFLQFWDELPELSPTSKLICCLLLNHNTRSQEFADNKEKACNFLKTLDPSAYPRIKLAILPQLQSVPRQEVINWLYEDINFQDFCDKHPTEFCNTSRAEDYIREAVYESPQEVKPMKVLAAKLDTLLDTYRCKR
jgi:hypothetical protein